VLRLQQAITEKDEINRDLVQTSIFGLGVLSARVPTSSYPLTDVLQVIQWVYSLELKTERGQRAECCENATSTLAKLVYYHGAALPSLTEVVEQGVAGKMPLTTDTEEAQATHSLFLKQVVERNSNLVTPAHLAALKGAVERIGQICESKPELEILDDEGKQLLSQAVQVLSS